MATGIVGFGEIGQSLAEVYKKGNMETIAYDPFKDLHGDISKCQIVNVAIPFYTYEQFSQAIADLTLQTGAIIIIHSTLPLGMTKKLQNAFNALSIVHSPVRGVHPNLCQGLLTFEKYIGLPEPASDAVITNLSQHFISLNIQVTFCKSGESELAKVASTTLYGLMIAAVEDIGRICDAHELDFEMVYTRWQKEYNDGYKKLGKQNVCRPVLTRIPNKQKVIGGHCVQNNCVLLKKTGPKDVTEHMAEFVLRYSNENSLGHKAKAPGETNDTRFN